jgi:hypothetical protein
MSAGKPRDVQKEHFWRTTIQRWQASRLSIRAFCQQQALSKAQFHAWRRTLATRDAQATAFAAVTLLPEPTPQLPASTTTGTLELVLANHRVVRILPGFDAATLRRLLPLLEEDTPC